MASSRTIKTWSAPKRRRDRNATPPGEAPTAPICLRRCHRWHPWLGYSMSIKFWGRLWLGVVRGLKTWPPTFLLSMLIPHRSDRTASASTSTPAPIALSFSLSRLQRRTAAVGGLAGAPIADQDKTARDVFPIQSAPPLDEARVARGWNFLPFFADLARTAAISQ